MSQDRWNLGFTLGAALLAGRVPHAGVGSYDLIVAAYGAGNVAGNLVVGNTVIRRRPLALFGSKLILALAFVVVALAPSLPLATAGVAVAALGGPMDGPTFLSRVQPEVPREKIGRAYSLTMVAGDASSVVGLSLAPLIFSVVSIRATIAARAVVMAAVGVTGLSRLPSDA